MESKNLFTVTITGAENDVREYVSDCLLVIAHNLESAERGEMDFNMSLNTSAPKATLLMLLEAMDRAKHQLFEDDPELETMYRRLQKLKGETGNA